MALKDSDPKQTWLLLSFLPRVGLSIQPVFPCVSLSPYMVGLSSTTCQEDT